MLSLDSAFLICIVAVSGQRCHLLKPSPLQAVQMVPASQCKRQPLCKTDWRDSWLQIHPIFLTSVTSPCARSSCLRCCCCCSAEGTASGDTKSTATCRGCKQPRAASATEAHPVLLFRWVDPYYLIKNQLHLILFPTVYRRRLYRYHLHHQAAPSQYNEKDQNPGVDTGSAQLCSTCTAQHVIHHWLDMHQGAPRGLPV